MPTSPVVNLVEKIKNRRLDDGGFSEQDQGSFRPDATSWAVLALYNAGVDPKIIGFTLSRLARIRLRDRQLPFSTSLEKNV